LVRKYNKYNGFKDNVRNIVLYTESKGRGACYAGPTPLGPPRGGASEAGPPLTKYVVYNYL